MINLSLLSRISPSLLVQVCVLDDTQRHNLREIQVSVVVKWTSHLGFDSRLIILSSIAQYHDPDQIHLGKLDLYTRSCPSLYLIAWCQFLTSKPNNMAAVHLQSCLTDLLSTRSDNEEILLLFVILHTNHNNSRPSNRINHVRRMHAVIARLL